MKKLTLDLDSLRLDSFAPVDTPEAKGGTVRGFDSTATDGCPGSYPFHCPPQLTHGCA